MERNRVQLDGGCRCPGAPHPFDWVDVVETVPIELGSGVVACFREADGNSVIAEGLMGRVALRFGIERWSFVEADGEAVNITWDNIVRLLPFGDGGYDVADRVMDLHSGEILRPLLKRSSKPSPGGPTAEPTSAIPDTGTKPPRPLKPSSRTVTDGTPSEDPVAAG